jgi:hypothetical protein
VPQEAGTVACVLLYHFTTDAGASAIQDDGRIEATWLLADTRVEDGGDIEDEDG